MTAASLSVLSAPTAPTRSAWHRLPLVWPHPALEPTLDLLNPTAPPVDPFPHCGRTTGLALYPTATGVEVQWTLPVVELAPALAAFATSATTPQLYLHLYYRQTGDSDSAATPPPLATAQLTPAHIPHGWARYVMAPRAGEYRVELGVQDTSGGWLLLARSPCLTLAQPVGTTVLHAPRANPHRLTTGATTAADDQPLVLLQPLPATSPPIAPVTAPLIGGSGPLQPYPTQTVWVRGQVRIEGSAPPGTWLDLGGHPYQVGAGGHFMFHIAVNERGMIDTILRLFSQLPVEMRTPAMECVVEA